jgi:chromosome segregation ATPase
MFTQRNQLIEIKKQNEELQKRNEEFLQTIQNLKLANLKLSEEKDVLNTLPLKSFEKEKGSLKHQVEELTNDITIVEQTTETFEEENKCLKNQVVGLTNDITSFVKSTETFQKIIGSQKRINDKTGIGFNISETQKMYKNFFIPKPDKKVLVPKKCTF